jgi:drug/metabolite transporter (DMT)-like permease
MAVEEETSRPSAPPAAAQSLGAIAAMILATLAFTMGDAAMKLVAASVPTGQAVFVRCVISVILVTAVAAYTGALRNFRAALQPLVAWRSIGDAGSALFFQTALPRMTFADIMGVLQLTPLALTAASAIFLGATVGWRRWTAVGAGLVGAMLVIKPGTSAFNIWAVFAVMCVLCGVLRDLTTRRISNAVSPLVIMAISQSVVAVAALGLAVAETWVWRSGHVWVQITFAAIATLAGHLWIIASLRGGDIATVAPFRYAGIIWAILLGFFLWGELPDLLSIAGIAILIAAGLYTFHRESRLRRGG